MIRFANTHWPASRHGCTSFPRISEACGPTGVIQCSDLARIKESLEGCETGQFFASNRGFSVSQVFSESESLAASNESEEGANGPSGLWLWFFGSFLLLLLLCAFCVFVLFKRRRSATPVKEEDIPEFDEDAMTFADGEFFISQYGFSDRDESFGDDEEDVWGAAMPLHATDDDSEFVSGSGHWSDDAGYSDLSQLNGLEDSSSARTYDSPYSEDGFE
jgi:hypothetical protein